MGVCHVEGAEGREAKSHHGAAISWVRRMMFSSSVDSQRYFRERLYHGDLDGQVFAWDLPD